MSRTPAITGVISEGSLRDADVCPALLDTLELLGKKGIRAALALRATYADVIEADYEHDDSAALWSDAEDAINDLLPAGWYCGAIDGDGACIGIFAVESADPDDVWAGEIEEIDARIDDDLWSRRVA